jgi:hypothetical protein
MFSPHPVVRILLGSISGNSTPERLFAVHVTTEGSRHTCLLLTETHAPVTLADTPRKLNLPAIFNSHFGVTLEGNWVHDVCRFFYDLLQQSGPAPYLEYAEPPCPQAGTDWTITPLREVGGILRLECPRYLSSHAAA